MRDAVLSTLLGVLDATMALLASQHGVVLNVHLVHGDGLGDGVDWVREQTGPGWEEVREWRGRFEVCCEGECGESGEDRLEFFRMLVLYVFDVYYMKSCIFFPMAAYASSWKRKKKKATEINSP